MDNKPDLIELKVKMINDAYSWVVSFNGDLRLSKGQSFSSRLHNRHGLFVKFEKNNPGYENHKSCGLHVILISAY